jgi:hypothetical protein
VATAANRTREIRPSGMRGGLAETWAKVELGTRRATERARIGNSPSKVARAVFLPDHKNGILDKDKIGCIKRRGQQKRDFKTRGNSLGDVKENLKSFRAPWLSDYNSPTQAKNWAE